MARRRLVRPPTPGEVLRELVFSKRRITQEQLADAMKVSRYSINQLVNDRRGITAAMALRLAKAVGTTPEFWLNLQRNLDVFEARRQLAAELGSVRRIRRSTWKNDL